MNRKTLEKVTAGVLSAALMCGTVGAVIHAESAPAAAPAPAAVQAPAADTAASGSFTKDETVYVFTAADGTPGKVLVSSWLQNTDHAAVLTDRTQLNAVENVKGDEPFTQNGDQLVWQANGADIYYQGTTEKAVPVQMHIGYTLDGQQISAQELAGKSGRVTIRFDYHNTQRTNASINGKAVSIPVPFTVMTSVMLDDAVFHNVKVTNGKMENMGNQTAVLGLVFPGLQEGLGVDPADLAIPDYLEISADVENFALSETMTLVTSALLKDVDLDDWNLDDMKNDMNKLEDGVNQLMGGSNQLYDGLCTLLSQSQLLVDGIGQLSAGSSQLKAGAASLTDGAARLASGTKQLCDGLAALDGNSAMLNDGAAQVFRTLLSTASSQLAAAGVELPALTIDNYSQVLNGVIASLDPDAVYQTALDKVTAGVEARRGEITAAVTEAVQQQAAGEIQLAVTEAVRETVFAQVEQARPAFQQAVVQAALGQFGITSWEQYQAAIAAGLVTAEQQAAVDAAIEAAMADEVAKQMESEAVKGQIAAITQQKTAEKMESDEIKAIIDQNTEAQVQKIISDTMQSPEVQAQLAAAAEGAKAVIGLKTSLDSYNSFYLGLQAYTAGVGSAAAASQQLTDGTRTLQAGADTLSAGTQKLDGGVQAMQAKAPDLISGITQLRDGSGRLADGLDTLMEDGIRRLLNLTRNDLGDLSDRLNASLDAASAYTSFTGTASGVESAVKFIYKTAPVETAA